MALTGLAIAALAGLAKSEAIDRPKEKRQRKLAAETTRLSPWTGMRAAPVQEADPFGSALQFGVTGAQIGQGITQSNLNQAAANRFNTGGSIEGYGKNLYRYAPVEGSFTGPSFNQSPSDFWGLKSTKSSPW